MKRMLILALAMASLACSAGQSSKSDAQTPSPHLEGVLGAGIGYSTYLGGPNPDAAFATCETPDGGIIVVGSAGQGFPTTQGPAYGGGTSDGFIARFER
jgi:hypothetical protein